MRSFSVCTFLVFTFFAVSACLARDISRNLPDDAFSPKESRQVSVYLREARREQGGLETRKRKDEGFMQKILPLMVIPFMISSMMIPTALMGLKLMLLKNAFLGKIGILLLLINMFTRFNNRGGVYSHNINLSPPEKDAAMAHYGYNGDEEYGAYIHRRKRRKRDIL